jgi:conjugative transfer signal peptidase TraF
LLCLTVAKPQRPWLVWNATHSAPIGLYAVTPPKALRPGRFALARLPEPYRGLAARRHYLPANVPLVKRIAAANGDRVCASGNTITINGNRIATRRTADRRGRPLPSWEGCVRLRGAAFLLNPAVPSSFDGRYFGPIQRANILGEATPIWTR